MRVALYARYSSEQQSASSIDDQLRLCRERAAREAWTVVGDYKDPAISGASLQLRPGIKALMVAAQHQEFDVVVAEALDRLSRDQEDIAGLFKRLKFFRVRIVTLAEGEITALHIGFKGTMNAIALTDLAEKTHRGLRGRIEAGQSAGGKSYGYRAVPVLDGQPRGRLEIVPAEAAVVQQIFRAFGDGVSPKAITKTLNADGITGPRGGAWSPSTIHGHASRGTGILNNPLYIGQRNWNRQRWEKDPDTGKRVPRLKPPSELIVRGVPELRIIDDALWQAAKARQASTRSTITAGIVRARRPAYLFSKLTKCGVCGGGFTLSSHDRLTCNNARSRGTCTNRRSIKRQEVEARVLRAMRERFFEPGAVEAFRQGFKDEMERLRKEHVAHLAGARRELATVEREIRKLLQAVKDGFTALTINDELLALEARKAELTTATVEPPQPALHPQMGEVFRQKAMTLAAGLEHDEQRDAAREALRGFLEKIVIPPGDELLKVVGNFGAMLAAAEGRGASATSAVGYVGCGGSQPTLSAALAARGLRVRLRYVPRFLTHHTGRFPQLAHQCGRLKAAVC